MEAGSKPPYTVIRSRGTSANLLSSGCLSAPATPAQEPWFSPLVRECLSFPRCPHSEEFSWFWSQSVKCYRGGTSGKEPACQFRRHKRHGFNPWVGKITWRKHGYQFQYSCLEYPRTEEPDWLQSIGSQRVAHHWSDLACIRTVNSHFLIYTFIALGHNFFMSFSNVQLFNRSTLALLQHWALVTVAQWKI